MPPPSTKKAVPNFLLKKKEASAALSSQNQNPQLPLLSTQKETTTISQKSQTNMNPKSKIQSSQIGQNHSMIEKEYFPNLNKIREKDLKALDLNLQRCKEVYDFYERKGKNELEAIELGNALRSLGYLVSTLEVRELCENLQKIVKINNKSLKSGFIEFKDFAIAVYLVQNKLPNERELMSALQIFDKDTPGYINKDTLRGILIKIGDIIPEKDVIRIAHFTPPTIKRFILPCLQIWQQFDELFDSLPQDAKGNIQIQYILGTLMKPAFI